MDFPNIFVSSIILYFKNQITNLKSKLKIPIIFN